MFYIYLFSIIFCCAFSQGAAQAPTPLWNATWTDILKKDLLMTYDKYARPTNHYNATQVNISITIVHIDIDERKSILSTNCWFHMSWQDEKLQWDPVLYDNLTMLHLGNHEIWQPDIVLYNTASDIEHYGNTQVIVSYQGIVIWVPPTQYESFCELDLSYWPYDTQQCILKMGSWTHDGKQIELWPNAEPIQHEVLIRNNEWQITNSSYEREVKLYPCCAEEYVSVQFNFTLKRRANIFRAVVTVPAIGVVLMTLATFCLPVNSGQKILLNGFNVISVILLLMYFTTRLGNMAISTPFIVVFYSTSLYLIIFSMLISVVVINISSKRNSRRPLPWILKKTLDGDFGKFLGIERSPQKSNQQRDQELRDQPFDEHGTSDDDHIIQLTATNASIQEDWINLAKAVDRVCLISYTAIFVLTTILYVI